MISKSAIFVTCYMSSINVHVMGREMNFTQKKKEKEKNLMQGLGR